MKSDLEVLAVALDIAVGEPLENISRMSRCMRGLPAEVKLVVFPELCTTGFVADQERLSELAERDDEMTMLTMRQLAIEYHRYIAGSFLATDRKGNYYNRAFMVTPEGAVTFYNKRHLFILSPESRLMSAGDDRPPVVDVDGWKVALAVCYDLRFPVWLRNVDMCYDAMLMPANWPQARRHAWETLLRARAIENQAYMVGADCSGRDNYGVYDEMTHVYDYMGQEIGSDIIVGGQPAVKARFNRAEFEQYRHHAPFYRSADDFTL